jgi:general secretion pathway protein G
MKKHTPEFDAMKHAKNRRGFTLLELTLVIALLGVLMAIVVTQVAGTGARQKKKLTRMGLDNVKSALESYNLEYSSYPPDLDTMIRIKPPMVEAKNMKDAWDNPYIYDARKVSDDQPFTLGSAGPDKVIGNEDDLTVWDAPK